MSFRGIFAAEARGSKFARESVKNRTALRSVEREIIFSSRAVVNARVYGESVAYET